MTAAHAAVAYNNVAAWQSVFFSLLDSARLYGYTVVADGNIHACYFDAVTGIGVDAVGGGHARGIEQSEVVKFYIPAKIWMYVPAGRIFDRYAKHCDVGAAVEENSARAPRHTHHAVVEVPIARRGVAVDDSAARYGDIFTVVCREQRGETGDLLPLPRTQIDVADEPRQSGILHSVGYADEHGAFIEIERHIAL